MRSIPYILAATLCSLPAYIQAGGNCCDKAPAYIADFDQPTERQTIRSQNAEIGAHCITRLGDSLIVEFRAHIPERYLLSNEAYVMTPVMLTTQGKVVPLPPISVEGRDYYYVSSTPERLNKRIRYSRDSITVHYRQAIPMAPGLSRAGLRVDALRRSLCQDGEDYSAFSTLLCPAGADLSVFSGKKQILYYIPASYTESSSYTDDFGGKSVFRINAVTVDKQVFDPTMERALAGYENLKGNPEVDIRDIDLTVSASPDGSYAYNEYLANARARNIRKPFERSLGAKEISRARITAQAENWESFERELPESAIRDKAAVERILKEYADPDARERELRKLSDWPVIYAIFNDSRNCRLVIGYRERKSHRHNCKINGQGLVESRLNAPSGYITLAEARRIASADASPAHLNNVMVAAIESGDYALAKDYARRISDEKLDPAIAGNKAVLFSLTGDGKEADRYFRMAGGSHGANFNKGVMLLNEGKEEEAAGLLEPYLKK